MKLPLTGQTYQTLTRAVNLQECQNWYLSSDPTGKQQAVLYPTPGLALLASVGAGACRGQLETSDGTFAVYGSQVYKLTYPTGGTLVGSLNTSSGPVSMAYNPTQLMIVDGTNGYYVTLATPTSVTVISDADYPDTATHVVFVDGFFIVNDPANAGRFWVSDSYSATAWTSSQFATAERSPDALRAIEVANRVVYLLGKNTTELWYNSGASPMPFTPVPGALIDIGIDAAHSVARNDTTLYWLGRTERGHAMVVAANGPQYQAISTEAIEYQINTFSTTSDAEGWCYTQAGHTFYVLTFPSADKTLVYDITTGMWHTRKSFGVGRWRAAWHALIENKHIVGDYNSGNMYEMKLETYTDNSDVIERQRVSHHVSTENDEWMFFGKCYIEMEHGVGDNTTTNPLVMLSWSDDHGNTWSNELIRPVGVLGGYKTCAYFHQLGRSKDRVWKVRFTDPVKAVLLGGYVEVYSEKDETIR